MRLLVDPIGVTVVWCQGAGRQMIPPWTAFNLPRSALPR